MDIFSKELSSDVGGAGNVGNVGGVGGVGDDLKKLLSGRELERRCRLLGAAHIDYLYRLMQEEDVGLGLRIKFQEVLNKMGGIGGEDVSGATRVEIRIERA